MEIEIQMIKVKNRLVTMAVIYLFQHLIQVEATSGPKDWEEEIVIWDMQ